MKRLLLLPIVALTLSALHAAEPAKSAEKAAPAAKDVAVIETTIFIETPEGIKTVDGTMVAEFWPDVAPKTVANFIKLSKSGFYNGTAFHRIMPGFMIQGGDPLTKDKANEDRFGTGDPGYKIDAEFNAHKHVRGVLSMARSADPNSAGSQFFIMLGDAPFLDGAYTAFGQLIKGDDVLKRISETPVVDGGRGEVSKPTQRVEVKSIKIVPASSIK